MLTNWEERTVENSFEEVSQFASNLAASLENRVSTCITEGVGKSMFFDIEEVFMHMCGERLPNNRVRVKEGDLEVFEAENFERFFKEVCSLKHIVSLNDERFDERLHQSVFRQWKDAIRFLVWDKAMKNELLSCLQPTADNNITSAVVADPETQLIKVSIAPQETSRLNLQTSFHFEFANHPAFVAFVDEGKVTSLLYTNEILYDKVGIVAMTAFDIAMSMGGSEAIVESFYSVMDTQRQVRQQHSTLEDRSILDWATCNVLNLDGIVSRAARLYVDGMPSIKFPHHCVGTLKRKTSTSYKANQVLTHMKSERGRYPFLS